jgi:hypothetical protein
VFPYFRYPLGLYLRINQRSFLSVCLFACNRRRAALTSPQQQYIEVAHFVAAETSVKTILTSVPHGGNSMMSFSGKGFVDTG